MNESNSAINRIACDLRLQVPSALAALDVGKLDYVL